MNKKYAVFYVVCSFFTQIIGDDHLVYNPKTFTEIVQSCFDRWNNAPSVWDVDLSNIFADSSKKLNNNVQSNTNQTDADLLSQVKNYTLDNKKIILSVALIALVVYKYGFFSSSKELVLTPEEIKDIVMEVLQDQRVHKQYKMRKIIQILRDHGVSNIIQYDAYKIEIDESIIVEIHGNSVLCSKV